LKNKIAKFESKYSSTFKEFSKKMPDTAAAHNDWIEWSFLSTTLEELQLSVEKLVHLLGR